ncbi:MAG: RNA polymerase sigma factor [Chitinophagaceae bacterium]|nr:RNA polymerase sigma factor [Chitinophagaceae bacterium]
MTGNQEIEHIIRECAKLQRESQKKFYTTFYGYAMSVCLRYTSNPHDAVEIVNDGFLKVFKDLGSFKPKYENVEASLKGWIRQIMVHTAIDHFRKNHKHQLYLEMDDTVIEQEDQAGNSIDHMSYKEIMALVQRLSPVYRAVFNLYVIDGYKHEEIAKHLKITTGTSKSNLARARMNIQKMLQQATVKVYEQKAI